MKNIEIMSKEFAAPEIEDIKAKRESFISEYVAAMRNLRAKGGSSCDMSPISDYKCNACEAVFQADHPDGRYCPACRGSDLKEIKLGERIDQGIWSQISDMMAAEDEAQIKELWSQKLSKKAIADKMGINTCKVSDVVGIKKRGLTKEKIDYIRNAHLSGLSIWKIKYNLGISKKRVEKVIGDLCREILNTYNQGILPEDIGKTIGIHGQDQAIIDIVNRFIESELLLRDEVSSCFEEVPEFSTM
jgi:hypothetical protein